MPRLFDRKRKPSPIDELLRSAAPDDAAPQPARLPEPYAAYVPASVRTPEKQRIGAWVPDLDAEPSEEPDADIEFLTALVNGETRARTLPSAAALSIRKEQEPDAQMDALEVFRAHDAEHVVAASKMLNVPQVELGDLLEDLSTVAAALRNRKAA